MADSFDPYLHWLGIRSQDRPPNHYALLGVSLYEGDADVLMSAADRQMAHVRTFQSGKHSAESQRLLNEIATAKVCLLNPDRKTAYDAQLRSVKWQKPAGALPVATPLPPSPPSPKSEPQIAFKPKPGGLSPPGVVPTIKVESSDPLDDLLPNVSLSTAPRSPDATIQAVRNIAVVVVVIGLFTISIFEGVKAYKRYYEAQAALSAQKAAAASRDAVPSVPEPPPLPSPKPLPESAAAEELPKTPVPPKQPEIAQPTPPAIEKPEPPIDLRLDTPDSQAQAAALREIRSFFAVRYKNAKDREQKIELARSFLQQAGESRDNSAARFALYCEARDLAVTVGEAALLSSVLEAIAHDYKVDQQSMAADALVKAAKKSRDAAGNQALAKLALEMTESAMKKEDDDLAGRLAEVGRELARKSRDTAIVKQSVSLLRSVDERKRLRAAFAAAEQELTENPDDPRINQIAGLYYCLVKADWDRGLTLLLKTDDSSLKDLIGGEQSPPPTTPVEMVSLGERWREAQKTVKEANRYLARTRAIYWYRRAVPDAVGVTKTKAEMRLAELSESPPESRPGPGQ